MMTDSAWLKSFIQRNTLPLCDFESQITTALIKADQKRPSLDAKAHPTPVGPQRPVHTSRPNAIVRFDRIDHYVCRKAEVQKGWM